MTAFHDIDTVGEHPAAFLARRGTVFATFDRTQDSGNVSYGVAVDGERFFVKTAGDPGPPRAGEPAPYLDHGGRVALLRTAAELAGSVDHAALAPFLTTIESPVGPMLVYRWVEGELVGVPAARRADPTSAYRRFAGLPASELLAAFDRLIDLHDHLGRSGWVAQDLYDGCLIYDFTVHRLTVIDLDTYSRGPVTNTMGRMFGASRFMPPEEFELGAVVDQRSTVFTLGRLAWHFGTRLTEQADAFAGPPALRDVVERASRPDRDGRHATIEEFARAWRTARVSKS